MVREAFISSFNKLINLNEWKRFIFLKNSININIAIIGYK